jgi:sec-independent protein translocase protein TatA
MPFNIGPMEVVVVLVIALIILGPKRLPDAGRALGSGIRNFRRSLTFDTPAEGPKHSGDELTAGPNEPTQEAK